MNKQDAFATHLFERRSVLLLGLVAIWTPGSISAQDTLQQVYWDPGVRRPFVYTSAAWIHAESDREPVLQALLAVARMDGVDPAVNVAAARAAFQVARDDSRIRQAMMSIIRDPNANTSAMREAERLVVYVADDTTVAELRGLASAPTPSARRPDLINVLADLGDAHTLEWLDRSLAGPLGELEPMRGALTAAANRIRIQQNVPSLLAEVCAPQSAFDRGWLVRQAMRRGATPEQVRLPAIAYLRASGQPAPWDRAYRLWPLVSACVEYGILTPADADTLPVVHCLGRTRAMLEGDEASAVAWATLIEAKRAAFYRMPYSPPASVRVPTTGPSQPPSHPPAASARYVRRRPWPPPDRATLDRLFQWYSAQEWHGLSEQEKAHRFTMKACELRILDPDACARLASSQPAATQP